MDFDDSPEEAAFRAEVKAWLAENAKEYTQPLETPLSEADEILRAKDWQAKKADAGAEG